jgi:pimeloyl-ACP methyl ester carboxylesterase
MEAREQKVNGTAFIANNWPLRPHLPTILFIHGAGESGILWRAQVESLSEVNAVAPDLPGHGRSDGQGMSRIEDYAASVAGFVDAIGAARPVLCGLSLGGAIVLRLLLDWPRRFKAGILINSGARLRVLPLILETIENDYDAYLRSLSGLGLSDATNPSGMNEITQAMLACPQMVTLGDFRACDSFDVMEEVERIEVPVLVISASDDRMTPLKYGAYLADRIRCSSLVSIEGAGHLSPVEKPEEVSGAISAFIGAIRELK